MAYGPQRQLGANTPWAAAGHWEWGGAQSYCRESFPGGWLRGSRPHPLGKLTPTCGVGKGFSPGSDWQRPEGVGLPQQPGALTGLNRSNWGASL